MKRTAKKPRWLHKGELQSAALEILRGQPGPLTEEKIRRLSRIDFKLRKINSSQNSIGNTKRTLVRKLKEGKLRD